MPARRCRSERHRHSKFGMAPDAAWSCSRGRGGLVLLQETWRSGPAPGQIVGFYSCMPARRCRSEWHRMRHGPAPGDGEASSCSRGRGGPVLLQGNRRGSHVLLQGSERPRPAPREGEAWSCSRRNREGEAWSCSRRRGGLVLLQRKPRRGGLVLHQGKDPRGQSSNPQTRWTRSTVPSTFHSFASSLLAAARVSARLPGLVCLKVAAKRPFLSLSNLVLASENDLDTYLIAQKTV